MVENYNHLKRLGKHVERLESLERKADSIFQPVIASLSFTSLGMIGLATWNSITQTQFYQAAQDYIGGMF